MTVIRGNVDTKTWAAEYSESVSGLRHSHKHGISTIGGVLYLNPGSAGRRRFKLPITLATVDVTPGGLTLRIHDLGDL